jgi:hypothetical protein
MALYTLGLTAIVFQSRLLLNKILYEVEVSGGGAGGRTALDFHDYRVVLRLRFYILHFVVQHGTVGLEETVSRILELTGWEYIQVVVPRATTFLMMFVDPNHRPVFRKTFLLEYPVAWDNHEASSTMYPLIWRTKTPRLRAGFQIRPFLAPHGTDPAKLFDGFWLLVTTFPIRGHVMSGWE